MEHKYYEMRIHKKQQISDNTILISLAFANDEQNKFKFIAGQFVQLFITVNNKEYRRSYSIANSPEKISKTNLLEIALSHVDSGIASEFFKTATIGTTIKMRGPFGVLILPKNVTGNIVLIGTGTGLAPYRAMLPSLSLGFVQNCNITIISGFRSRSESIFQREFNDTQKIENFTCLSREKNIIANNELLGHVQSKIKLLRLDATKDLIYLCGNPYMINDCLTLFTELGFSSKQIKREKYIYSGH